jgi:hypothetical protein
MFNILYTDVGELTLKTLQQCSFLTDNNSEPFPESLS